VRLRSPEPIAIIAGIAKIVEIAKSPELLKTPGFWQFWHSWQFYRPDFATLTCSGSASGVVGLRPDNDAGCLPFRARLSIDSASNILR
jgi:hypothetical protein